MQKHKVHTNKEYANINMHKTYNTDEIKATNSIKLVFIKSVRQ